MINISHRKMNYFSCNHAMAYSGKRSLLVQTASLLFAILSIVLLFGGCEEKDTIMDSPEEHTGWIQLKIPEAREAYAVFGDLDQTLVVTTAVGKAYFATDKGKTWQVSHDFRGVIFGLYYTQDTLFALHGHSQSQSEANTSASLAQHYSLDSGKIWHDYYDWRKNELRQPLGIDTTTVGNIYQIKENVAPDGYVNPSEILKRNSKGTIEFSFPYAHHLHNLYLDSSNRLYVAAAGDRHNEEDNTLFCCFDALIYVSKQPLP